MLPRESMPPVAAVSGRVLEDRRVGDAEQAAIGRLDAAEVEDAAAVAGRGVVVDQAVLAIVSVPCDVRDAAAAPSAAAARRDPHVVELRRRR